MGLRQEVGLPVAKWLAKLSSFCHTPFLWSINTPVMPLCCATAVQLLLTVKANLVNTPTCEFYLSDLLVAVHIKAAPIN